MSDLDFTNTVAVPQSRWLPFEEARAFARALCLNSCLAWREWCASGARPENIPAAPNRIYAREWQGWADWLGHERTTKRRRSSGVALLPFEEARTFVRTLRLKTYEEWREWAKSADRPDNIPPDPRYAYLKEGWSGYADWLGTDSPAPIWGDDSFRPFEEARAFARSLSLQSFEEWKQYVQSGALPRDIPVHPQNRYAGRGWAGWADWLGHSGRKGRPSKRRGNYMPFEEARTCVRELGLKNYQEWRKWAKSKARPASIPFDPYRTYHQQGWLGWADWLGTERTYRPFAEAREFVHTLGLRTQAEWVAYTKSNNFPSDFPVSPERVYAQEGWIGVGDWLGTYNLWTYRSILGFLNSLKPVIQDLSEAELFLILSKNGLLRRSGRLRNATLVRGLIGLRTTKDVDEAMKKVSKELEKEQEDQSREEEPDVVDREASQKELEEESEFGRLQSVESLRKLDQVVGKCISDDQEIIDFLVANRVSMLWQQVMEGDPEFSLERIRSFSGGDYSVRVRDLFLEEYQGATQLPFPSNLRFERDGVPFQPNLMQRLTALRLSREKRLGNWSGVGAGKTHSAVLSAAILRAGLTVVVAANSTVAAWEKIVNECFPQAVVIVKERVVKLDPETPTFLLLNYEFFQQPWSLDFVRQLTSTHRIDFIVLDEVQLAKQRHGGRRSYRRQTLDGFLSLASAGNPALRVLGMSATPVVNNLLEATKMLEMITGNEFADFSTRPSVANAIGVHMQLKKYGIRYRPKYDMSLKEVLPILDGSDALDDLRHIRARDVLRMEQAVLKTKLRHLPEWLRPQTMVYTHYVDQIVDALDQTIHRSGYKVGRYTGEEKEGLKAFLDGKVDVLVGSSPVGTGVDGLQFVCNRLIFISLPWSHAEYEQIIGRLYRQNSVFDKVEVIIPKVVLNEKHAGFWSWDDQRLQCIHFKRNLGDAALDGLVPTGKLPSREEMQRRSLFALHEWITRVEEGAREAVREPHELV